MQIMKKMQVMKGIPEEYEIYCDIAFTLYRAGWRASDRERMIDELVTLWNGWTGKDIDIVCYLLERIENH